MVLHHVRLERIEHTHKGAAPLDVLLVALLVLLDDPVRVELRTVLHVADIGTRLGLHGDPPRRGSSLAHRAKVVEELLVAAVLVADFADGKHLLLQRLEPPGKRGGRHPVLRLLARTGLLHNAAHLLECSLYMLGLLGRQRTEGAAQINVAL